MHTAIDEELSGQAAAYALGALDPEEARAFEEHLRAGCEACAAELKGFGAVVEGLAYGAPPADPPDGAKGRLLKLVREGTGEPAELGCEEEQAGAARAEGAGDGFYILRAEEGEWKETDDEGVSYKLLYADQSRGLVTTLVRMRPGSRIRPHRHLGVEQCLVLEGDLSSGPHRMKAGDFNCSMPGSLHEELLTDGGALFLLVSPPRYEPLAD